LSKVGSNVGLGFFILLRILCLPISFVFGVKLR
jgi:hypothetical protein